MRVIYFIFFTISLFFLGGCVSSPRFDQNLVRHWQRDLDREAPSRRPYIAHHKKGPFELFYLAAHHDNNPNGDTLKLVEHLFREFKFDALIIEPIANSYGVSPAWFVADSRKGATDSFIKGGESALAAIRADEKKIPFFGGEIDHKQLYNQLKIQGYDDQDVLGFYLTRQIPQWIRQKEERADLLEKKAPAFIAHYCKTFEIESKKCPTLGQIKEWYQKKNNKNLGLVVTTEDVAPRVDGSLFTHKISSSIGSIRDRFTLELIQTSLRKYKRVAVIYGGSHYMTLRKSLESSMRPPHQVVLPSDPSIQYVGIPEDPKFRKYVDESISTLLDFSEKEELGVKSVQSFVTNVFLYGTKSEFDKMISSSPDWKKDASVPKNYVGVGFNKTFHVVSWTAYKQIHPDDSIEDYKKLLTHELAHLLHVAFLNGKENDMGPIWFFEGFACLAANQYPEAAVNLRVTKEIINKAERGSYKDYVAIVRKLNEVKTISELLKMASQKDFNRQSLKIILRKLDAKHE